MDMNEKTKALYEAHVAFVLDSFGPAKLPGIIGEESGFIWDQLDSVKLGDVLSKQEILDFQERNFEHRRKVSDPAKTYARSILTICIITTSMLGIQLLILHKIISTY